MVTLTTEQVLAMSPDTSSTKAGQGLANPGKWVTLGRNARSVWGECQGSGKNPYRTQADLNGPAFNCSCPSRKFPCKHGLGLLLLMAAQTPRLVEAEAPAWVNDWIAKRESGAEKKTAKAKEETAPADPETLAEREADREKRAAKREDRVRAGLAELQVWLSDLARQGLAHAKQQPSQFYDGMAARMIDAQAPGVARRLRELPAIFASGDGWADRALEEAGALQLLLQGFANLEALSDPMKATVRSAIGWTVAEQELIEAPTVRDRWQIVGQRVEEEDRIRVQRTWLVGETSKQSALSLSFAAGSQPLDISLVPGTVIEADLAFYPSAAPLRALVRIRHGEIRPITEPAATADFGAVLDNAASLRAGDPWIERTPCFVSGCHVLHTGQGWIIHDAAGAVMPLSKAFQNGWPLLSVSGGNPVTIFGEWDGYSLLPLSVFADGRFITIGGKLP